MQPVELMEGYVSKLKTADKDLRKLEKAAKNLAEKHASTEEQRSVIEEDLRGRERSIAALQGERADLQLEWMQSDFEGDVQAKREIQGRREALDKELQEHQDSIRGLRSSLGQLEPYEKDAAQLAAEIEALEFGDGWRFSRQLEPVLVKNQHALQARQTEARRQLPSFTEATRRAVDGANDEQRERDDAEQARREAQRREDEAKAKLTNKVVRNDEGIVIGVRSFDADGNFVKYTDAKMVSKTG